MMRRLAVSALISLLFLDMAYVYRSYAPLQIALGFAGFVALTYAWDGWSSLSPSLRFYAVCVGWLTIGSFFLSDILGIYHIDPRANFASGFLKMLYFFAGIACYRWSFQSKQLS